MTTETMTAASTMLADTGTPGTPAATEPPASAPAAPEGPQATPEAQASASITMPGKDATPEQWEQFYAALRPETPDAYELPVPEGDSGEFAKEAASWMHEAGLTKDQAGKLAEKYNAMAAAQQQQWQQEADAAAQAQHVKNTAEAGELQREWGQEFGANMHQARIAVQQFLPKEGAADIISAIESKVGYKATIQFLHNIGTRLGEHDAAGLGADNSGAPAKSMADRLYGGAKQA